MTSKPINNVKAYTTPRQFSGFQVPISLQSTAIRRYCEERGLQFNLHANENITANSYLVLERLIIESQTYRGIAMCSIGMLPVDHQYRTSLVERSIEAGLALHFVFEQIVVSSVSQVNSLNNLVLLGSFADRSPELLNNLSKTDNTL